jgi:hypothetical protein
MRNTFFAVVAALLSAVPNLSHAAREAEIRAQMFKQADLVFVGKVVRVNCCKDVANERDRRHLEFSAARIDIPIKGTREGEVVFSFTSGIIDFQPDCCDEGATYLFYLKAIPGEKWYRSEGGVYSITAIR